MDEDSQFTTNYLPLLTFSFLNVVLTAKMSSLSERMCNMSDVTLLFTATHHTALLLSNRSVITSPLFYPPTAPSRLQTKPLVRKSFRPAVFKFAAGALLVSLLFPSRPRSSSRLFPMVGLLLGSGSVLRFLPSS